MALPGRPRRDGADLSGVAAEGAVNSGIFEKALQDRDSVDGLRKKLSFGRSQSADLPGTEWVSGIDNRKPKHFNTEGHGE
jgi:hypothetical protein